MQMLLATLGNHPSSKKKQALSGTEERQKGPQLCSSAVIIQALGLGE